MILAILPFTGFLGLDHLYLHSPGTFALKAIFNVLTLGYWYFHDAIQAVYHESEGVAENGLSIPWFGPAGLGAGSFSGGGSGQEAPQSSWTFMAYVLSAMFVPFGLDYLVAGDYLGAVWKYMSIFMFGIGFVYGLINLYKIFFKPAEVMCQGTYRYFPFTLVSEKMTGSAASFTTKVGCPPVPVGESASLLDFFRGVSRSLNRIPVVGPKMAAPIDAAVATVEGVAATAQATAETVKGAVATVAAAGDMVTRQIPAAVETAGAVAAAVTPAGLAAMAQEGIRAAAVRPLAGPPLPPLPQMPQAGGGIISDVAATATAASPVLIFTFALIFVSSAYVTINRSLGKLKEWMKDMPPMPVPSGVAEPTEYNTANTADVGDLPPRAPEPGFF